MDTQFVWFCWVETSPRHHLYLLFISCIKLTVTEWKVCKQIATSIFETNSDQHFLHQLHGRLAVYDSFPFQCTRQPWLLHGGVFFTPCGRPTRRLRGLRGAKSSWLAGVHAARALHASASASSAPRCVSSVRPLYRPWILRNEVKHSDLFGNILHRSRWPLRHWMSSQSLIRRPEVKNVTFLQCKYQDFSFGHAGRE